MFFCLDPAAGPQVLPPGSVLPPGAVPMLQPPPAPDAEHGVALGLPSFCLGVWHLAAVYAVRSVFIVAVVYAVRSFLSRAPTCERQWQTSCAANSCAALISVAKRESAV